MRNAILTAFVLASCGVLAGSAVGQTPMSFNAGFAVFSNYTWRGYQVQDAASLQPHAQVSWPNQGFSLSLFSALAVQDRDTYEDLDKVELAVAYAHQFATQVPMNVNVGFLYHDFPRIDSDNANTTEIFASAGWESIAKPTLKVYFDVDATEALYINPSIGHAFKLDQNGQYALNLQLGAGLTDKLLNTDGEEGFGLQDVQALASVDFKIGGNGVVRPTIGFNHAAETVYADENLFWGGASLDWTW